MRDGSVKKLLARLLLPALLLGTLTGCGPEEVPAPLPDQTVQEPAQTPEASPAAPQETAAAVLAVETAAGFDPYNTVSACNRLVLEMVLEPLFTVTEDGQAVPVLAEGWTVTPDGKTTEVLLRQDVVFHDGTPLSAEAVADCVRRAAAGSVYAGRFYAVESVEAVDPRIVRFTTSKAYECFPLLLDIPITSGEEALPIGTGPYIWNGLERLLPSTVWWREGHPADQLITLHPVDGATDLRDGFQYGGVTAVWVDPNDSGAVHYTGEYELWDVPSAQLQYIGFNLEKGIFTSKKLRAAVTWAVDREAVVTEDLSGFGVPAMLVTLPGSVWDVPELKEGLGYDPSQLTGSLTASGLTATMIVSSENAQRLISAERIASQLTDCGIRVTVKPLSAAEFRSALQKGEFDLYYAEARLSPTLDLSPFFSQNGALSYGGLASGELQNLCDLVLANRGNSYDLQKRIMEDGLLCPVAFKTTACYLHRGVFRAPTPKLGGWLWQ